MSKGVATCTCKICGETFTKQTTKRNSREAAEWVEWAEKNIDTCPSCYGKQAIEKEKADGLVAKVRLGDPYATKKTIWFVLYGDTYPIKEKLKEMGAWYTDEYPDTDSGIGATLFYGLSGKPPLRRWAIQTDTDGLETVGEKLEQLGFSCIYPDDSTIQSWLYTHADVMKRKNEAAAKAIQEIDKAKAEMQKLLDELGPIPAWPDEFRALWPDGARWNGKIYGRSGSFNVYFGGQKTNISDGLKKEVEKAQAARVEWRKKKEAITG